LTSIYKPTQPIFEPRSRIPSAHHNTYMKANLRKKKLLPLSRATWSVLHDRHYFHHHRHRPQNDNLLTIDDEKSLQTQRLHSSRISHDLTVNLPPCQHQTSPWHSLKSPKGYSKTLNHFLRRQNILENKDRFSALNKTSRSSTDPGELNRFSKSVHLHSFSSSKHTSVYSTEEISSRERYMRDQSSSSLWRNSIQVNKTSDISNQVVSRNHLSSPKPNSELAEKY